MVSQMPTRIRRAKALALHGNYHAEAGTREYITQCFIDQLQGALQQRRGGEVSDTSHVLVRILGAWEKSREPLAVFWDRIAESRRKQISRIIIKMVERVLRGLPGMVEEETSRVCACGGFQQRLDKDRQQNLRGDKEKQPMTPSSVIYWHVHLLPDLASIGP